MRFDMNDNAFGAAVAIATALIMSSMAYCMSIERKHVTEVDKARVISGLCQSQPGGEWVKCK